MSDKTEKNKVTIYPEPNFSAMCNKLEFKNARLKQRVTELEEQIKELREALETIKRVSVSSTSEIGWPDRMMKIWDIAVAVLARKKKKDD